MFAVLSIGQCAFLIPSSKSRVGHNSLLIVTMSYSIVQFLVQHTVKYIDQISVSQLTAA